MAPIITEMRYDIPKTAIAKALAHEDMSGFDELYQKYYRRVYAICLRMTHNIAEAEDLTQDVFIHISKKLHSFKGKAAFTTWLHRVTVNTVLMYFRHKNSRKIDDLIPLTDGLDANDGFYSSDEDSVINEIDLDYSAKRLPPGYLRIWSLHDVEGYEHEEIAQRLGCSAGTSKSQLHKARLRMQELLEPDRYGTYKSILKQQYDPFPHLIERIGLVVVNEILVKFPPRERNWFKAYYIERQKVAEIAEQYQKTTATVNAALIKARRRFWHLAKIYNTDLQ